MILFYVLIFAMPLAHHRIFAAFYGDMTVIKYLGCTCLPVALVHYATRRPRPSFFRTWHSGAFIFLVCWANVSYVLMGPPMPWSWNHGATFTSYLLLFFLTLILVDSLRRLRWVLLVALAAIGFASLHVCREWQIYHTIYPGFRPGIVDNDPNYFTATALLCLPLAFYFMQGKRPKWERLFCLGCMVVTLAAVSLAASRGGLLGIGVAFLYVAIRSGRPVRNLVLAGALLLPITFFMPASPWDRLLHPSGSDVKSTDTRMAVWMGGWRMIKAHPIIGVGLDRFMWELGKYVTPDEFPEGNIAIHIAHNSYIEFASEMGLLGLLPFLAILVGTLQTLEQVRRRMKNHSGHMLHQTALGLQGGMLGFIVTIFFVSGQFEKLFWLFVFVAMCIPALVDAELAAEAEASKAVDGRSPVAVRNGIQVPAGAAWRTHPSPGTPAGRSAASGERPWSASREFFGATPITARKP